MQRSIDSFSPGQAPGAHAAPHFATTSDGWRLAITHLCAAGAKAQRCPLVMVHGLGANHHNFDLSGPDSLAHAATARGFEVYLLDLRGSGASEPPPGVTAATWGFAEHAERDLPAALAWITRHSGHARPIGVGHSLGGMVWYAHACKHPRDLQAIVSLGTPLLRSLYPGKSLDERRRRFFLRLARLTPERLQQPLPLSRLLRGADRFVPQPHGLAVGFLLNACNTEPERLTRMAQIGINDVPLRLLAEIGRALDTPGDVPAFRHEDALCRLDLPVLALAGDHDRVVPAASVAALAAALPAHRVRYHELGPLQGERSHYGHQDLLLGRDAPCEVFTRVLDFCEAAP